MLLKYETNHTEHLIQTYSLKWIHVKLITSCKTIGFYHCHTVIL